MGRFKEYGNIKLVRNIYLEIQVPIVISFALLDRLLGKNKINCIKIEKE